MWGAIVSPCAARKKTPARAAGEKSLFLGRETKKRGVQKSGPRAQRGKSSAAWKAASPPAERAKKGAPVRGKTPGRERKITLRGATQVQKGKAFFFCSSSVREEDRGRCRPPLGHCLLFAAPEGLAAGGPILCAGEKQRYSCAVLAVFINYYSMGKRAVSMGKWAKSRAFAH